MYNLVGPTTIKTDSDTPGVSLSSPSSLILCVARRVSVVDDEVEVGQGGVGADVLGHGHLDSLHVEPGDLVVLSKLFFHSELLTTFLYEYITKFFPFFHILRTSNDDLLW